MRRTSGNTTITVGKATIHDRPQAPSQRPKKPGGKPTARSVLISETTKVISSVSSNGITSVA